MTGITGAVTCDRSAASGTTGSKSGSGSKAPAAPLYCNTLKPCSTFSIALPTSAPKGSKGVWKLGSKSNRSGNFIVKPGSKGVNGSKGLKGSKAGKTGSLGSLTLFVVYRAILGLAVLAVLLGR